MAFEFPYTNLVNINLIKSSFTYQVIVQVKDFNTKHDCILVNGLNPDYFLLFGHIKLIISKNGSKLSHLAILAREHGVSILLIDNIPEQIAKRGLLVVKEDNLKIDTYK